MQVRVAYNDNDPFVCAWLAELIKAGELSEGGLFQGSIKDLNGEDLKDYGHIHLFSGISGWPLGLRLAGWPAGRRVLTGSCPCQPYSVAGKRGGDADERNLWPEMLRIICECRPPTIFGEQVASKDGRIWLSGVRSDLEALGYAVGAADLCAAGVGAPHIRQRLFWVANAMPTGRPQGRSSAGGGQATSGGATGGMGNSQSLGRARWTHGEDEGWRKYASGYPSQDASRLGNVVCDGLEGSGERSAWELLSSPWAASVAIPCADGKFRRVATNGQAEIEPSLFPLAHGVPNRMGTLRGAGNAIVPLLAAEFVRAFMEAEQ